MSKCDYARFTTRSGLVYASCTPKICSPTRIFQLATLLRESTTFENELLKEDCSTGTAEALTSQNGPLPVPPVVDSPNHVATPTNVAGQPAPSLSSAQTSAAGSSTSYQFRRPSKRPAGLSYDHWIRDQRHQDFIDDFGQIPRQATIEQFVSSGAAAANACEIDLMGLPATQGAYGAKIYKRLERLEDKDLPLEEAKALGLEEYGWNGEDPVPFVVNDQVFMVLAGRPGGPGYKAATEAMFDRMEQEASHAGFSADVSSHRRGRYPSLNVGVTHGMGTLRPTYLDNRKYKTTVDRLLGDPCVRRVATYGSSAFALWAPETYNYYKANLDRVFHNMPFLRRIFDRSIFPAATFNFGPKVYALKHRDAKNCPFGWCAVTALGRFDPTKGGHLIIWELGLAIQFPPGSTILLPSATLTHSNVCVAADETRASFTQYCSGGLFRWVDYGFKTERELKEKDPSLYEKIYLLRPDRWKIGVNLWSTLKELRNRQGFAAPRS